MNYVAGIELAGFLAPFLIPAASGSAEQNLSAASGGLMRMPVVAASGFKGHVADGDAFQIVLTTY